MEQDDDRRRKLTSFIPGVVPTDDQRAALLRRPGQFPLVFLLLIVGLAAACLVGYRAGVVIWSESFNPLQFGGGVPFCCVPLVLLGVTLIAGKGDAALFAGVGLLAAALFMAVAIGALEDGYFTLGVVLPLGAPVVMLVAAACATVGVLWRRITIPWACAAVVVFLLLGVYAQLLAQQAARHIP